MALKPRVLAFALCIVRLCAATITMSAATFFAAAMALRYVMDIAPDDMPHYMVVGLAMMPALYLMYFMYVEVGRYRKATRVWRKEWKNLD